MRGDAGYAGAVNRDYCKEHDITTSFSKRGRPSSDRKVKDAVRQELARVRATAAGYNTDLPPHSNYR